MRRQLLLAMLTGGVVLCPAPGAAQAQGDGLDARTRAAVTAVLTRFDATASAKGRLDAGARSALFTDDAIVINAFSTNIEGRAAVDAFWRELYTSTTFDSSRIELLDRRLRRLGPGLVLVDHLERLTGQRGPRSGRELPPRTTRITLILQREPAGVWRIRYYRAGDQRTVGARTEAAVPDSTAAPPR